MSISQKNSVSEVKNIKTKTHNNDYIFGLICVIGCQLTWGFLPIYLHFLKPIDPKIIILYRLVTMFIFALIGARLKYSFSEIFEPLKKTKTAITNVLAGFLLTIDWSIYIWAVNSGHVIQTSIGYYIEPIIICLFGILIFKEKITPYNIIAIAMAISAVILILVHYKQLPGVAVSLALTWAFYSAIKKGTDTPIIIALVNETIVFAVIALALIIYMETNKMGAIYQYGTNIKYYMMLMSGLATVVPVALFGISTRKVGLLVVGLAQYISPTITLICGVRLFGETLEKTQFIAFIIIWIGIVIFTVGEIIGQRNPKIIKSTKRMK